MTESEKLDLASADIREEQRAKLKTLFPEVLTEGGKIDFERLKLTLGEAVDPGKERYGLNWPGKADCFKTIQMPSRATLVPARSESVNFDTTENLIIEGDNLEVLKLLQKSYLGQVKMIYIDPPYNTGNDFIYPDNFTESLETYLQYTGQVDVEGRKFSTNTEADGRFHSKWLNMMYPRLFLARNLLSEDGTIFISIDDHELDNLRKVCSEVFGEENFLACVVWQKVFAPKPAAKTFSTSHDYILVFAKQIDSWGRRLLPRGSEQDERYRNPDNDARGPWASDNLLRNEHRDNSVYTITSPTGKKWTPKEGTSWRHPEEEMLRLIETNQIWFGSDGNGMPRRKKFLSEVQQGLVPETLWKHTDVGHTQEAKREIIDLFGFDIFETPKPSRLIKHAAQFTTGESDIVLDFFAGSGTTGHAILGLNKADGGNRKFILVQLPEPTDRKDFSTIADIAKERVRRVIKKLNDEDSGSLALENGAKPDRGFKVFTLKGSNFKAWNADAPKDAHQLGKQLEMHVQHIEAGRTQEDILFEILLKSGFPLATRIETLKLAGQTVFSIAEGAMLVCLEKELTDAVIKEIAARKPERVVCLDAGFAGNDQLKTNAAQTFKAKGVTSFRTV